MGVTISIALVFWLASSYIEYKIIKSIPASKKFFDNPLGGILISIGIGMFVGAAIGNQSGLGVFLGQILGLATNNFTYKLYSSLAQVNQASKEFMGQARVTYNQNREAVANIAHSFFALGRAIVLFFGFIIKILSIPGRIANFFSRGGYAKSLN